jgi:tRNA A-37 threonylcarbamoyl transferase component Bud32/tetratricopeptide (TPR) repeat protein
MEHEERLKAALADRYAIEGEIGSGGMATVYLATDIRHERKVALKVLRPDLAASLGAERFLQEVRVTANLQHPHILPLFDSGEADGFLFYVMPYIEGESLRERLVREHELPVSEAARLLRDVVDALVAAHKLGVVHRDIKPENVLISGRHAMVADFGVAKAVSEATGRHKLTTLGVALGTPSYMAPEQAAADEAIDHRADIYAVGAMAYELLAGRPPFTAGTPQQVLAAQVMEAPQPVTELRASVPPALETLIMRCLEKKPADRWQSAEEMLPHLEAAASPSGGMTPTDMQPVTVSGPPTQRPSRRWMTGGAVVAVVALAVLGIWKWTPDGEPALDPRVVAVMPFENLTGDQGLDEVGRRASMVLTQVLQNTRLVAVKNYDNAWMTFDHVQSLVEQGEVFNRVEVFASEIGAGTVIHGAYQIEGDRLCFDASITDALSGTLGRPLERVCGDQSSPRIAVEALQPRVMGAMAMEFDSTLVPYVNQTAHTPTDEAAREFALGVGLYLRGGRNMDAVERLLRAHELDPDFTTALLFAGWAHSDYRYTPADRRVLDSIWGELYKHRSELPPYERAIAEGYRGFLENDRRRHVDGLAEACGLAPGEKACYNLGHTLTNVMNQPRRAAEVLSEQLVPEKGWMRGWHPYWIHLFEAYHASGEFALALEAANQGRVHYPRSPQLALGRVFALVALGRVDEVFSFLEDSLPSIPSSTPLGNTMRQVGHVLDRHGFHEDASRAWTLSVRWFEDRLGQDPEDRSLPLMLAHSLHRLGRLDEAEGFLGRSAELNPGRPSEPAFVGWISAQRGDLAEGRRVIDWLDAQEEASPLSVLRWKARIAAAMGEKEEAVGYLEELAAHPNIYSLRLERRYFYIPHLYGYAPYEELYWPEGR